MMADEEMQRLLGQPPAVLAAQILALRRSIDFLEQNIAYLNSLLTPSKED